VFFKFTVFVSLAQREFEVNHLNILLLFVYPTPCKKCSQISNTQTRQKTILTLNILRICAIKTERNIPKIRLHNYFIKEKFK